jgi:hypothetical protein
MVLETFVVGLWYVATYLKPHHVVGVDDAVMPLALVFNIGFCILCIRELRFQFEHSTIRNDD